MTIIQPKEFAQRRKKLMEKMGAGSIALISSAPECIRTGDCEYPYRPDSEFYYLTGFTEPEAIAVLIPGRPQGEFILFNRKRDPAKEVWTGRRMGQEGVIKNYGADEAFPIDEFPQKLTELLLGQTRICFCIGRYPAFDQQIMDAINKLTSKVRMGVVAPREFVNLEEWLHPMRQIKSVAEIETMRQAAKISSKAHQRAMKFCKPGIFEYQLEAELQYEFYKNGSRASAYNSIVGGGENSCILHYNENNALLNDGDLVLIDAGCEFEQYASDITRIFPVNGRFTNEQRAIYELVLSAQLAGIEAAKPDNTFDAVHEASLKTLVAGLVKLGLLQGNVKNLIEEKAYMPFYMHRTSHWLGLDTHDVGTYKEGDHWCHLEPGMVLTVEPGIYIAANTPNVDKKWWNIGVRIEDDVLITKDGCDVLSADAPKTVHEIESLMAKN